MLLADLSLHRATLEETVPGNSKSRTDANRPLGASLTLAQIGLRSLGRCGSGIGVVPAVQTHNAADGVVLQDSTASASSRRATHVGGGTHASKSWPSPKEGDSRLAVGSPEGAPLRGTGNFSTHAVK